MVKQSFYRLRSLIPNNPHRVYPIRNRQKPYGLAEWSQKAGGMLTGRIRGVDAVPLVDLTIILPSQRVGDFVWTSYKDCIVTERTLSLFRQAGFTGFQPRPVTVEKIKTLSRKRREEIVIPPLWELVILGKGGDAAPESGIHVLYKIEGTDSFSYSSFRNGILVDEANWDGSDFFTINGYPKYILITERVKEFIMAHELTNCALIPSHKLEWGAGTRPEDLLARKKANAGRPLELLLVDLENQDLCMDTVFALGHKGDVRAVDPLIGKFEHPDPLIWDSAADAVAEIAEHKETPEHIREEIFTKLCDLLGHEDPLMRNGAATALMRIGGERAAKQLMRLFDDPDDWVRSKGVFTVGVILYKPALEAIKRLTKDRSKMVREMAKKMVIRLSTEYP